MKLLGRSVCYNGECVCSPERMTHIAQCIALLMWLLSREGVLILMIGRQLSLGVIGSEADVGWSRG